MLTNIKIVSFLSGAYIVFSVLFVNFSHFILEDLPNDLVEISVLNTTSNEIEVNEIQEFDTENELFSELIFKQDYSPFRINFPNKYHNNKLSNVFKILLTPPPEAASSIYFQKLSYV